jgi:hypothetical protein
MLRRVFKMSNPNYSNCEICNKQVCLFHKKVEDPEEFEACAICEKAICQDCIDDNVLHEGFVCIECGKKLKEIELITAFSPENIKMCIGSQIIINDCIFTLSFSEEMSGLLAVWTSEKYLIYAEPNFDGIGVPVDVWNIEESIGDNYYAPAVSTFEEYKEKVQNMSEEIIRKFEEGL